MSFSKIALLRSGLLLMFFSLSYLTSSAQVIWQEDWETYSLGIMDDNEPETKGWDSRLGFGSGQWSVLSDGAGNQYISRLNKANECCYWKGCRMLREETQAYDDVYYGFRFKFDSNFDFKSGGKLNGVIGGNDPSPGVPTDGASGSSVSLMWRKHPNGQDAYMHTYTYSENKDDQWGQRDTFVDASNNMIKIVRDKWYSIVVKINMNTQNVADGRITVFLDGVQVMDRNDYLFRSGSGTWGWDINQLIYFFGGNGPGWAPGTDSYVYEDDWVFSESLPTHLMNGYFPPEEPVADLVVSSASGLSPHTVTLDASGSTDPDGSINSYRWKFGDGSGVIVTSTPTISHTYTTHGQFEAKLTITDDDGLTDIDVVAINSLNPNPTVKPVADIQVSSTSGTSPFTVNFDASGSTDSNGEIINYRWKFGDGSNIVSGTSPTISHTYTQQGTFTAKLSVLDDEGLADVETKTIVVLASNIQGPPVAKLTVSANSGTAPLTVTFDGSKSFDLGSGTIASYKWRFDDGTPVQQGNLPVVTHTYTNPGVYSAKFVVIDNSGVATKKFITITVTDQAPLQPPVAAMSLSSTSGTLPFTVNFNASGSHDPDGSVASYRWKYGDGTPVESGTSPTASHTFTQAGVFQVRLTVVDNDGKLGFKTKTVTVVAPPADCEPLVDWTYSDIGSVGIGGGVCYKSGDGEFEISASGEDIWNNSDEFGYLHQPMSGDGELIMKLDYLQNTHTYSKIGLMMREDLSPDSKHAMIVMNQTQRALQYRKTDGGTTMPNSGSWIGPTYSHPTWFKLQRLGNVFGAFLSGDGSSWTLVDTVHVSMGTSMYAGIALTSHNNTRINTSVVSNVTFSDYAAGAVPQFFGFNADEGPGGVVLTWSTGGELNSDYFTVESSIDGIFFQTLDRLDGAGTAVGLNEYRTIDPEPRVGLTYYRLFQTDFSGQSTMLATASYLAEEGAMERVSIYPNPVTNHQFTVVVDGLPLDLTKEIRVLDPRGREIYVNKINDAELSVNLPADLPQGIYQVRVSYQGGILGETIVVR